ncbi:DUF2509 family protein [Orbus sturtevantii]|uniref:DUF2509 family protein n=1 Tax=Orbus sturtevantii TaxID=3074109 RepID=UPI00370DC6E8
MLKTKIAKTSLQNCQGFSALGMAMILLLLGGILIAEFGRTSFLAQKKMIYKKQYYIAENRALSSIQWAITLAWSEPTQLWQCQRLASLELNACIKKSSLSTGPYVIIRGTFEQIKRYHLATYNQHNGLLSIENGHWLDYCPDNRESNCDE